MSAGRIWLIGGTSESAEIARALSQAHLDYVVTVTTHAAKALYPAAATVCVGQLSQQAMEAFVQQWQIRGIVDASHPFACEISRQAIALAKPSALSSATSSAPSSVLSGSSTIAYRRYERPTIVPELPFSQNTSTDSTSTDNDTVIYVKSIEKLLNSDILHHQRVFLSLGYRHLARFAPLRQTAQLFARVLPSVDAISGAIAAGFSSSEIVAIRPPVSPDLEAALWQQWHITQVVAKASGAAGGEATKRQVAKQLGIRLVLIERPQLMYPAQIHTVSDAVAFCRKTLSLY
ncbi:MAG: cobalt-precorrin-6A reductase [Cyanobacteria bacterium J06614_10]